MEQASDKPEARDSQPSIDEDRPTTLTPFQKAIVEASREAFEWAANHPSPSLEGRHYRDIVRK